MYDLIQLIMRVGSVTGAGADCPRRSARPVRGGGAGMMLDLNVSEEGPRDRRCVDDRSPVVAAP